MVIKFQETIEKTFWQLLGIYSLFILSIALGFLKNYSLYFNIFALIIGIFGISIISQSHEENNQQDKKISKKFHIIIFVIAIVIILLTRFIPYIHNSIPLGYDAGLYKYSIEHSLDGRDSWPYMVMEPGFLYLMKPLSRIFSTNFLLIYGFIFCIILLGLAIYIFSKEYFDDDIAIFALLIYSLSLVQFKVFTYLYYKNILALSLLLFSFYFLNKKNYKFFILTGILIGIMHRPTFYIFGLSYFLYSFTSPYELKSYNYKKLKYNILFGAIILFGTLIFYIGRFKNEILVLISPVLSSFAETGTAPGTFITFIDYQFSILFYLPLAILGIFHIIKNKKFNIFFYYTILCFLIVYFQLFFFNRFIIFLDIALIILSALGLTIIIKKKKTLGLIISMILIISGLIMISSLSINTHPDISQDTFNSIKSINIAEKSYIISFSSEFSPYLQGWTKNKIIAPGLFDYDLWHSEARWEKFWKDKNASDLKDYYREDIYLFTTIKDLNTSCYEKISLNLYNWLC